jgi:gliding motility-associated-like protein
LAHHDADGDSIYIGSILKYRHIQHAGRPAYAEPPISFSSAPVWHVEAKPSSIRLCDATQCDTLQITVACVCPQQVFLPEGFSPDGDGINDKLVFKGLEYFSPATLQVLNRYGTIVYDSEDYKNEWDGTANDSGKALPDGTYFYTLQLANGRRYNKYLIINR